MKIRTLSIVLTACALVMCTSGFAQSETGKPAKERASEKVQKAEQPTQGVATIHYKRVDGNYDGWGLHLWGNSVEETKWAVPVLFTKDNYSDALKTMKVEAGKTDFGPYIKIHWNYTKYREKELAPKKSRAPEVEYIVHKGDRKDPGPDFKFNQISNPEVWLVQGSFEIFYSKADALKYFEKVHGKK